MGQASAHTTPHAGSDFLMGTWLYDGSGVLTECPGTLLTALCGTLRVINVEVDQPELPLELGIPDWTRDALVPGAGVAKAMRTANLLMRPEGLLVHVLWGVGPLLPHLMFRTTRRGCHS